MHIADRPADVVGLPMRSFLCPFLRSLLLPLVLVFRFERPEEQKLSQIMKRSEWGKVETLNLSAFVLYSYIASIKARHLDLQYSVISTYLLHHRCAILSLLSIPPTLPTLRKPTHPSQYEDANLDFLPLCRSGSGNMATTCPVHLRLDVLVALTKRNIQLLARKCNQCRMCSATYPPVFTDLRCPDK